MTGTVKHVRKAEGQHVLYVASREPRIAGVETTELATPRRYSRVASNEHAALQLHGLEESAG